MVRKNEFVEEEKKLPLDELLKSLLDE